MFLIGLVQTDLTVKEYVAQWGGKNQPVPQKKAVGKTTKSVLQVMLSALKSGAEAMPIQPFKTNGEGGYNHGTSTFGEWNAS